MRINKYLSESGICSRREADRLIQAGHVSINGNPAAAGMQVTDGDKVTVDGRTVRPKTRKTVLKLYKPVGVTCTFDKKDKSGLAYYLHYPVRVTYAGRLDRDSEGLLILTDDGDLIQSMMTARNLHEKEYEVEVDGDIDEDFLSGMRDGVWLEDLHVRTRRCSVTKTGPGSFRIILTQGLNRQIRRMCEACGRHVTRLKRVRVVNVMLDDMKPGELRKLTAGEEKALREAVK